MPHYHFKNVNDAFATLVELIDKADKGAAERSDIGMATYRTSSRNGDVIQVDQPVIVTYENPLQRVLFNAARDANPFFHLLESLWMLAGRNDIKPLTDIVAKYADFSDDGKTANGAYGYRWRRASQLIKLSDELCPQGYLDSPFDQLGVLADHLKNKPDSRRAVLTMWNVNDDLLKINDVRGVCRHCRGRAHFVEGGVGGDCAVCNGTGVQEKIPASKDVCCNLNVMFSVRKEDMTQRRHAEESMLDSTPYADSPRQYLDMTVTNRSNDLVWGMLGANVVHFSFLQEYMAARIGVEVGQYHHFTNNLHTYTWNWEPEKWLAYYKPMTMHDPVVYDIMYNRRIETVPLVSNVEKFDSEVGQFIDAPKEHYNEPFLQDVAGPMMYALDLYKREKYDDMKQMVLNIQAEDWRTAAALWLGRRLTKKGVKV